MSTPEEDIVLAAIVGSTFVPRESVKAERIAEIPIDLKHEYGKLRPDLAAMLMSTYGLHEVLDKGHPNCSHERVLYTEEGFDGSVLYCDECSMHEKLGYSPGLKIPFPPNALIRTPDPKLGEGKYYSRKANESGIIENELPVDQWKEFKPSQSEVSAMFGFYHRPRLDFYKKFPME